MTAASLIATTSCAAAAMASSRLSWELRVAPSPLLATMKSPSGVSCSKSAHVMAGTPAPASASSANALINSVGIPHLPAMRGCGRCMFAPSTPSASSGLIGVMTPYCKSAISVSSAIVSVSRSVNALPRFRALAALMAVVVVVVMVVVGVGGGVVGCAGVYIAGG